jgi:predicted Zn finger-like uncharacterized protein
VPPLVHTLSCPACSRELRVPDGLLGQLVKCPACGNTFTAPESPDRIPAAPRRAAPAADDREVIPPRDDDDPREAEEVPPRRRASDERDRDEDDRPRPRSRRDRKPPDKVHALSVMTLVGGIVAILWSVGWMLTCVGLLWPGTYYSLVCGIIAVVRGCQLLSGNMFAEGPPTATAILQIINVINLDLINLVLGILILTFLNDDEVKRFFRT